MDFAAAVAYLDSHADRGVQPGLERAQFLLDLLDYPERGAPGIHITGTNGKGSTARMVQALFGTGGLSTGMFTSPYLQSITESIMLDGQPLTEEAFAALMTELAPCFDHLEAVRGEGPTYFEIKTVMAFKAFADRGIDVAVVEVGLGGRWDTTNTFDGQVAVVTNVDVDHVNFLGADRRAIAAEKAGIVKAGSTAVVGERDPDIVAVIEERCREVGAESWRMGVDFDVEADDLAVGGQVVALRTPAGVYRDVFLPLHGRYQAANAACAVAALEAFYGGALAEDLVREALMAARSPGRLEIVGRDPLVVLDAAHNPHGAAALAAAIPETFTYDNRVVVVGILGDKDRAGMLGHLVSGAHVVATAPDYHRAVPADVLAKEALESGAIGSEVVATVAGALDRARLLAGPGDLVLVVGSVYTVGEARTHILGPGPAV